MLICNLPIALELFAMFATINLVLYYYRQMISFVYQKNINILPFPQDDEFV